MANAKAIDPIQSEVVVSRTNMRARRLTTKNSVSDPIAARTASRPMDSTRPGGRSPPKRDKHHPAHGEAPWPIVLALTATATGTVLLFFFPGVPLTLAKMMMGLN